MIDHQYPVNNVLSWRRRLSLKTGERQLVFILYTIDVSLA